MENNKECYSTCMLGYYVNNLVIPYFLGSINKFKSREQRTWIIYKVLIP